MLTQENKTTATSPTTVSPGDSDNGMSPQQKSCRRTAKKLLDQLVSTFPLAFPVQLRWNQCSVENRAESYVRVGSSGARGYLGFSDSEDFYTIHHLMAHEYAHLMVHFYPGQDQDAVWALAYRETYEELFGSH